MKDKEFRLCISKELHTDLRVLSAVEGKTMHQIIVESIERTITEATAKGKLHKKEMKT